MSNHLAPAPSTQPTATDNKRIRRHLANAKGQPKCGRQLSRPASSTANQISMQVTGDLSEVKCRHCLRAIGLLAPVTRTISHEEAEDNYEAERAFDEEGEDEN